MRRELAALTLAIGICVPLIGGPASAATLSDLYVNNATGANCSDAGTGTETQPFCTLAAATAVVTAGQTVHVSGTYNERLTVTNSGTPDSPITFRAGPIGAHLSAPPGGITIEGQHDVAITGFSVSGVLSAPGVVVSNSTRVSLERVWVGGNGSSPAAPGIQLNAVTDSSLTKSFSKGSLTAGITLDAATTRVLVKSTLVAIPATANKGIDILGSNNTIVADSVAGSHVAGISIGPGASDNVVVNNYVSSGRGRGIHNTSATGTAITNNTVYWTCGTGIQVDGNSSGVSVQNNVATSNNRYVEPGCDPSITGEVNIGVYDDATNGTVVDYNTVYNGGPFSYAWNEPMGLAAFRAASGQAAHDIYSPYSYVNVDSANSAAPGWQNTDYFGHSREDYPGGLNKGAGPISYADRGYREAVGAPTARVVVTAWRTRTGTSITADASGSTTWAPTTISTYTFDFGDGTTVTQATPIAVHFYPAGGSYQVSVTVTNTNGLVGSAVATQWTYRTLPRRPVASFGFSRYPIPRRI